MLADDNCRSCWKEDTYNHAISHGKVDKVLDEYKRFDSKGFPQYSHLVNLLKGIRKGTVTSVKQMIETVIEAAHPFEHGA
jgi:glycerol-3-phosphate dehydrogenase